MNIHQLMKEDVLSTISKFRHCFQMQRLLFMCHDAYFQKRALIWRASFPCIHLAAPEEEGYRIILGAHDRTQEYCFDLWSWKSQRYNSKSVFAVARTAKWLTASLRSSEVNSSLDPWEGRHGHPARKQTPKARCLDLHKYAPFIIGSASGSPLLEFQKYLKRLTIAGPLTAISAHHPALLL